MPVIGTDIAYAAAELRAGRLVAFATETVYGIGADAKNAAAVAALYRIKRRPKSHPLIVHLSDFAAAEEWAAVPDAARKLAARFTPGPLTLLLPRLPHVPAALCGGGDYVALRAPSHARARRLLAAFGGAVAAPSANRFGNVSPTTAAHVAAEFAGEDGLYILDGGACAIGIESAIAGFAGGAPFVIRHGDIGADAIAACVGRALVPPPPLRAPGNLPRHYAPQTPLYIAAARDIAALLAAAPDTAMSAAAPDAAGVISRQRPPAVPPRHWRLAADEPRRYARRLYAHLRALDALRLSRIIAERPPQTPPWRAVNDRLARAASVG